MGPGNLDVIAAILQLGVDGSSKKILQDETELTPSLLDKQLALLESKNLVRILRDENGNIGSVKTTERGAKFLEMYEAMRAKYLSINPI